MKINQSNITTSMEKASAKFDAFLSETEAKLYDEAIKEIKNLEIDSQGDIRWTANNLKRIDQIITKLKKVSDSPAYLAGVEKFVQRFNNLQDQITDWARRNFNVLRFGQDLETKTKYLKQIAIKNTIDGLTGANINAYVMEPIKQMLMTAVTTEAKYSDLTKQLQRELISSPDGTSALAKYAKTYATTAMTQYAGQQNKLFTDDLGVEWFRYVGGTIETTRDFCNLLTQKEYIHISEIPAIIKGEIEIGGEIKTCPLNQKTGLPQGLIEGTTPENFQVNVGGWNCRHQLLPISEESVPENLREKFKRPIKKAKSAKIEKPAPKKQQTNKPKPKPKAEPKIAENIPTPTIRRYEGDIYYTTKSIFKKEFKTNTDNAFHDDQIMQSYVYKIEQQEYKNGIYDVGKAKQYLTTVDTDSLIATQWHVNKESVDAMVANFSEKPQSYPVGVRVNGHIYLIDGHHRSAAQILMGRKQIQIVLLDLPQKDVDMLKGKL